MAEVEFRDVRKSYGDTPVIHGVSMTIRDGEFVVIVGPSGCGKSTLLRMVAGLEQITGGEIAIGGRVVNRLEPKDRDIAMVFQNYALYPHMSVFDNMAYGLKIRGMPKAEIRERVAEAARILELEDYLPRKPRQLSGGQRQRVAMGRAIVREPKAFLFDEPLSNLDAKLRVQMRVELKKLHTRLATTSVYVTHDQVEAMTLGDRVVVMKDGVVQQMGEPLELYDTPANRFVAGFIGSPAMNFAEVTIEREDDRLYAVNDVMRLRVADETAARLDRHGARKAVFGVRPENLHIAAAADPDDMVFDAAVEVIEQLGSASLLDVKAGSTTMVAAVEPQRHTRIGDRIRLAVDASRVHFFVAATERVV